MGFTYETFTEAREPKQGIWVFKKRTQLGWGEDFKPGDTIEVRSTYTDTNWRGETRVMVEYALGDGHGNAVPLARWEELVQQGAVRYQGGRFHEALTETLYVKVSLNSDLWAREDPRPYVVYITDRDDVTGRGRAEVIGRFSKRMANVVAKRTGQRRGLDVELAK